MTPQELLLPRIKVIAPMPGMTNEVGTYLEAIQHSTGVSFLIQYIDRPVSYPIEMFEQWPHIFLVAPWWMDREVGDMPEYVKNAYGNQMQKVTWTMGKIQDGPWAIFRDGNSDHAQNCLPATAQEYTDYLNQQIANLPQTHQIK